MSLRSRLKTMVDGLPDGASVTLPAGEIRAMLEEEPESEKEDRLADLTVEEVAEEFDRSVSAVRAWCQQGRIPGAYKLRNREWRIPPAGIRAFQEAEANGNGRPPARTGPSKGDDDLGGWRDHMHQNGEKR